MCFSPRRHSTGLALAALLLGASCDAPDTRALHNAADALPPPAPPPGPAPDGTDPSEPVEVRPAAAQIRLLSAAEYQNTVRDLLGLETHAALAWADLSNGYDSGAGLRLDENLFSVLSTEADDLAGRWVRERAQLDFACFHPAAISDACVEQIVDSLGLRAQRRPLAPAFRAELLAAFAAVSGEDDPTPQGPCDPETQPPGHFETRDGRCRPSCGIVGGQCGSIASGCGEGMGPAGVAHDCELCCAVGGAFVDEPRLAGLQQVVLRLLMSARFLYRTEMGVDGELDPFERAALVSYALTGSMPDAPLFADALADTLSPGALAGHVRRLLASEHGQARMAHMIQQWVRASDLDAMATTPADFPKLASPEQGRALRDEVAAFTRSASFEGSGTIEELLSSSTGFVNRHNADLYGVSSDSDALVPTALDPEERAGLLTLPGVMAAHAWRDNVENDRPVKRGLLVMNKLFCRKLQLPENFVPGLPDPESIDDFEFLTTRDQFEAMMQQNQGCLGCHRQFMPYGFAFASYDGLGRYRTHQRGLPINPHVDDVTFDGERHSFTGAPDMMRRIAQSPTVARCFAENFVQYTLGTAALLQADGTASTEHIDTLTEAIVQGLAGDVGHIPSVIEAVLTSPDTYRRSAP